MSDGVGGRSICTAYYNLLQRSGYNINHRTNTYKLYVLPTQFIYVFCVDIRTNIDYFPTQH
jgi:hypothetical protein